MSPERVWPHEASRGVCGARRARRSGRIACPRPLRPHVRVPGEDALFPTLLSPTHPLTVYSSDLKESAVTMFADMVLDTSKTHVRATCARGRTPHPDSPLARPPLAVSSSSTTGRSASQPSLQILQTRSTTSLLQSSTALSPPRRSPASSTTPRRSGSRAGDSSSSSQPSWDLPREPPQRLTTLPSPRRPSLAPRGRTTAPSTAASCVRWGSQLHVHLSLKLQPLCCGRPAPQVVRRRRPLPKRR